MDIAGNPSGNTTPAAQQALTTLAGNVDDEVALDTLAGSDVLVPVAGEPEDAGEADGPGAPPEVAEDVLTLPVLEQRGGVQMVPVFTSETRLASTFPSIAQYRVIPLGLLAARWPSDELSLAIDAGAPNSLTLTAEGVRTLLARP